MGIDLRAKRKDFPDRCKWYKGAYVVNQQLVSDAICQGIFYSRDAKDYEEYRQTEFGVSSHTHKKVTIETPDFIPEITINDYVVYDGELWRVDQIPMKNDDSNNKRYSNRPMTLTQLILVR